QPGADLLRRQVLEVRAQLVVELALETPPFEQQPPEGSDPRAERHDPLPPISMFDIEAPARRIGGRTRPVKAGRRWSLPEADPCRLAAARCPRRPRTRPPVPAVARPASRPSTARIAASSTRARSGGRRRASRHPIPHFPPRRPATRLRFPGDPPPRSLPAATR